MKKLTILLAALTLLLCIIPCAPSVCASQYIHSLGLSISFPNGYEVVTREMVENGYSTEHQTSDELLAYWETAHIYANAVAASDQVEITLSMTDSDLSDFKNNTDEELEMIADILSTQYLSDYNFDITNRKIHRTGQNAFLCMWYKNPFAENTYSLQYFTCINGRAYNITLHSHRTEVTPYHERLMNYVASTVQFNTSSLTFTAESGAVFTVPEGWVQADFYESREYLDAKFVSESKNGDCVLFSCYDLWSEMTAAEREGFSRADVNHKSISLEDVRTMLTEGGILIERLVKNTIADCIYYCAEGVLSVEPDIETAVAIRVENGWLYMFQYTSLHSVTAYNLYDFVETIQYPAPTVTTTTVTTTTTTRITTTKTTATTSATTSATAAPVVPSDILKYLCIIGAVSVVILISVIGIRLALRPTKHRGTAVAPEHSTLPPALRYCRYCGKKLPPDSLFCPFCGKALGE